VATTTIGAMHATSASSLQSWVSEIPVGIEQGNQHTFTPGLPVKLPFNFVNAPLTLSPTLGLRLWCVAGVAVVRPVV